MKKNNYLLYVFIYLISLFINQACGQTGKLYIPDNANKERNKNE